MKEYRATAAIRAAPEAIWAILLDTGAYPEWDPFCDGIEGQVALGGTLRVSTKLSPGRVFPVTVTDLVPARKMTWSGGMPLGLFKGERTFTLSPEANGLTQFTLHEVFSGLLFPLIARSIPDMTDPFEQFAAGLKKRAETR